MDFSVKLTPELLAQLANSANGAPVYLDSCEPELEDPARTLGAHQWLPACRTTSKLTRCLEAVRDLASALAPLAAAASSHL